MALGDFTILEQSSMQGARGSRLYNVGTAATNVINPGEPVIRPLGNTTVTRMYNTATTGIAQPAVGTDYVVGIASTASTQTATAVGTVNVIPTNSGTTFLVTPNDTTAWNTQAKYDALVGKRVLIDLTSGAYTALASDSANNGLIIMPLDISKYPGKVAVVFRAALSDVA